MIALLEKWHIPGASLAVAKNGRFVLAKAYGYADVERQEPATPDLQFRIASLSKSLTAAAVMKLVEQGRLDLDQPALPLLGAWGPPPQDILDSRIYKITIRHLLTHSAGWDREVGGDPSFDAREFIPAPDCRGILTAELTRKLDFAPGTSFTYSNTGYCFLGRIIERVSGMSYGAFVRQSILEPAGADRMTLTRRGEISRR